MHYDMPPMRPVNRTPGNEAPISSAIDDPIIEFQQVTYSVKGRTAPLISQLSLAVNSRETLVLLGRSGSGKTTLLRLINRMLVPSSGEVVVEGKSTVNWDAIRLRRHIGYVIQEAGLFPHFTVAENVGLVPKLEKWDPARIEKRTDELLKIVGLDPKEFASRRPAQLSGGQRQRVGVARALGADPSILLMDEPFGALDPVTRSELQREFSALAQRLGKTIVFVTHDLREALLLASRIVLLQNGRIVASAEPQEFLRIDHPEVKAFSATLHGVPGAPA
ncbi:MAG: osmoprotectant transport system ATP-binding protein [Acidobacteriaceae bacterium]|jgi:osmoprotectant transport system ATP-binding protein|nr:osmoprotectant transport system ATP-binding protein [Acidobacteriaceae bacterium]